VAHSAQIRQISEQYHEALWQGFDEEDMLCRTDESYWSGNFHEQLDLFQESCRKAMERRSRLLKQMDGHPVYLKWERFLPLFHDPDAKYVGNPLWG
jgi:hypothetical protein